VGKEACLFVGLLIGGTSWCDASDFPTGVVITVQDLQDAEVNRIGQKIEIAEVKRELEGAADPQKKDQLCDKGGMCNPCGLCSCVGVVVKACQEEYWRAGLELLGFFLGQQAAKK